MDIQDIMRKPALTVNPDVSMLEVARMLVDSGTGCCVVVGPRGQAQGVLTVRDFVPHDPGNPFNTDLARRVFGKSLLKHGLESIYREARILTAGKMMRPLNVVLDVEDSLERAVDLMLRHDDTHIPVLRGHSPVGSVSRHDLVKVVLAVNEAPQTPTPTINEAKAPTATMKRRFERPTRRRTVSA